MSNVNRESTAPDSPEFSVENWIASAKNYVVPSDDLRPRVLEAAREIHSEKIRERNIGRALVSSSVLFWCLMLVYPFIESLQASHLSADQRIEQRTLELFEHQPMDIQSATQQAYSEWRASLNMQSSEIAEPLK